RWKSNPSCRRRKKQSRNSGRWLRTSLKRQSSSHWSACVLPMTLPPKKNGERLPSSTTVWLQEAAKKEAAFAAEKGSLVEHHEAFQQKYDALTESFGAERQKCSSLEAEIARITGAKEQADQRLQAVQEELRTACAAGDEEHRLRIAAETNAEEMAATKDAEVLAMKNDLTTLRDELERARSDLVQARQELDG